MREALTDGVSLSPAPDMLFQLISYLTGGERRKKAQALANGQDPDGDAATLDVLAALQKFSGIRPDPEAFIEALDVAAAARLFDLVVAQMQSRPRLAHGRCGALRGREAHASWRRIDLPGRPRSARRQDQGLCAEGAAFRAARRPERADHHDRPRHRLAPFRAFLQERQATNAPGGNWLYFGHQRSDYDFFYKDELVAMRSSGLLSRLTLAWSRDGKEKIYVQHRMRDDGRDLWEWLTRGAHIYVCGDALRMAKDVERALIDVVAEHGRRSPEDAARYVNELKKNDRYQADVY